MIQKVKELMAVKEEIDVIKNNIKYTTDAVSELKAEIEGTKDAMREHDENFRTQTEDLSKQLSAQLNSIQDMQKEFEKELFQFKLLKSQLQKKILEKFEQELDSELKLQMNVLKTDADQFQELRSDVSEMMKKINMLGDEIDKFTDISRNIKKGDFELKNFARSLAEADTEKLELMRKIDSLERLVSKMRRQQEPLVRR